MLAFPTFSIKPPIPIHYSSIPLFFFPFFHRGGDPRPAMAVYIRAKRVTDPLDERVSARLRGTITDYASSGSDHGSTADIPCFSHLIHAFIEHGDDPDPIQSPDENSDSDAENPAGKAAEQAKKLAEILNPAADSDPFRHRLRSELGSIGPGFRRAVMVRLRERGYNAGLCKSRWDTAKGLTAGSYEYIDVIEEDRRYIVDLGFAAEFAVARGTAEYGKVVAALPEMAVAFPEEVGEAVRIMAEAAEESMRRKGLFVPPWRKKRYMMAKWLGPYRRTVNWVPAVGGETVGGLRRTVGFGVQVAVAVE